MRAALAAWMRDALGAAAVEIDALEPLSGGAIQENWRLDATLRGGRLAGTHALVLRLDAPSQLAISHGRAAEFRLIEVARAAGVAAPEPVALCEDAAILGRPFFLMRRAPGRADARALTAAGPLPGLAARLGAELARLHAVRPPDPRLPFLGAPPPDHGRAEIAWLRGLLDALGAAEPALEWGLNRLEATAPPPVAPVLCHRDFRTGNYLVDDGRLAAILDWEFAGWGDPAADLGWLTAPCWRFARPGLAAGGVGTRAELLAGYAALARPPEDTRIRWWEALSTARWAVIALMQAARPEPSLELALTAHVVPELLVDLLEMTPVTGDDDTATLLALARDALKLEVLPLLPPDRRYPALMAMTALGVAARRAASGAAWRADGFAALAPFAPGAADLAAARATIARRLRADPAAASPGLHAALCTLARAACAESNPKARALGGLPIEPET